MTNLTFFFFLPSLVLILKSLPVECIIWSDHMMSSPAKALGPHPLSWKDINVVIESGCIRRILFCYFLLHNATAGYKIRHLGPLLMILKHMQKCFLFSYYIGNVSPPKGLSTQADFAACNQHHLMIKQVDWHLIMYICMFYWSQGVCMNDHLVQTSLLCCWQHIQFYTRGYAADVKDAIKDKQAFVWTIIALFNRLTIY